MANAFNITKDMIIKAQGGDRESQDKIVRSLHPEIEYELKRYVTESYDIDLYSELYQIGRNTVLKVIEKFDTTKYDVNKQYFKLWIHGDIKRGFFRKNKVEIVRDVDVETTDDLTIEINEISDILDSDLLTDKEKTVYINYTGFNHNITKTQKIIAEELSLSQVKVHRLYKSAYEKILKKMGVPNNKNVHKKVRRKIKNEFKVYTSDKRLEKLEDIFKHLNKMLPSHIPRFTLEKKLKDGSWIVNVWQGTPVEMDHDKKNVAHVDNETPHSELNTLMIFIQSFMDPHQKYNEPVMAFKVPSRTILIDFIRYYAPYTTRDKMSVLLKMLDINPSTIRVYLDEDPLVNFGREKSELFLTIFDNYTLRSGKNYIEFKDVDKILRVITLDKLLQMDSKGLIKPPYIVDRKQKIFKKNM